MIARVVNLLVHDETSCGVRRGAPPSSARYVRPMRGPLLLRRSSSSFCRTGLVSWCAGLALLGYAVPAAATVVLLATSVRVDPGDAAEVCVSLDSGGARVAGTQNDLVWDGSCATLPDASACEANGATGKQLHGDLSHQQDFTYKALVLSLDNVKPIPDGELYCCRFQITDAQAACCPVRITGAAAADPSGGKLGVTAGDPVCLTGLLPTATPTPTPIIDTIHDSNGCQIGASPSGTAAVTSLLWVMFLAAARRRR